MFLIQTDSDNESYHKKLLKNIKSLDRKNKTKRFVDRKKR